MAFWCFKIFTDLYLKKSIGVNYFIFILCKSLGTFWRLGDGFRENCGHPSLFGILPDFSIVFSSNKSSIRRLVPTFYCFQTSLRSPTLRVVTTEMFSNQVKFILTQALWSRCSINALGDVRSDGSLHGRGVGALGVEVAHPEGRQLLPREPGAPRLRLSCQIWMGWSFSLNTKWRKTWQYYVSNLCWLVNM